MSIFILFIFSILAKCFYGCGHKIFNYSNSGSTGCSKPYDVFIFLDISTDIERNEYDSALLKIANFIEKSDVGSYSIRFSLSIFSHSIHSVISLNSKESKQEMINRVESIEQSGDLKNMKKALQKARSIIENEKRDENLLIDRIVIILTNGRGIDLRSLNKELNILKKISKIITVGIGKKINKKILELLASCPDFFTSIDRMQEISRYIACFTCTLLPLNTRVKLNLKKEEKFFLSINIMNLSKSKIEILDVNLTTIYGLYVYFYSFSKKIHLNFFDPSFQLNAINEKLEENFRFMIPHGMHNLYFTIKGLNYINKFEIIALKYSYSKYYNNFFK